MQSGSLLSNLGQNLISLLNFGENLDTNHLRTRHVYNKECRVWSIHVSALMTWV